MNKCSAKSGLLTLVISLLASACAQTSEQPESSVEPPPLTGAAAAGVTPEIKRVVRLRTDHPQRYTVQPGDTLLDVAEVFLETPWRWTQVWNPDPSLEQPDQIYPGDVIELYQNNGQPRLRLIPATEPPTIKLSPQIRVEQFDRPIPTIPRSAIESFVLQSTVVNEAEWKNAPMVIGSEDDRVNMSTGDRVFVKSQEELDLSDYRVFSGGEKLRDPNTGRFLGVNGIYAGDATLVEEGNPATFLITRTRDTIQGGARLFEPEQEEEVFSFTPTPALPDTEGQIIQVLGDSVNARQYGSVIVNIGIDDGAAPGQMLVIYGPDRVISDPWIGDGVEAEVPGSQGGMLMLYKVYDAVSYALVTNMRGPIRVNDRVASPES